MKEAARSIIRRTGVSATPMISWLVSRAPIQCVRLMISGPATPGNEIFVPTGKTSHLMREHRAADQYLIVGDSPSRSPTSALIRTGTSTESCPSLSASTSAAEMTPTVANVSGLPTSG